MLQIGVVFNDGSILTAAYSMDEPILTMHKDFPQAVAFEILSVELPK